MINLRNDLKFIKDFFCNETPYWVRLVKKYGLYLRTFFDRRNRLRNGLLATFVISKWIVISLIFIGFIWLLPQGWLYLKILDKQKVSTVLTQEFEDLNKNYQSHYSFSDIDWIRQGLTVCGRVDLGIVYVGDKNLMSQKEYLIALERKNQSLMQNINKLKLRIFEVDQENAGPYLSGLKKSSSEKILILANEYGSKIRENKFGQATRHELYDVDKFGSINKETITKIAQRCDLGEVAVIRDILQRRLDTLSENEQKQREYYNCISARSTFFDFQECRR